MNTLYESVLRKIWSKLKDHHLNWGVTGSLGFALQGVDNEVHDIDIQTDYDSAYAIQTLFADFMTREVKFSSTHQIRSHLGAFEMDGIVIEIMGDIQKNLMMALGISYQSSRSYRMD